MDQNDQKYAFLPEHAVSVVHLPGVYKEAISFLQSHAFSTYKILHFAFENPYEFKILMPVTECAHARKIR